MIDLHIELKPNQRVFFASDLHLGYFERMDDHIEAQREEWAIEWLDMVEKAQPSHLFLLGDIFDYWFEYQHFAPSAAPRFRSKLLHMTQQKGIQVIFIPGNRDLWGGSNLAASTGMYLHPRDMMYVVINQQFFTLAHGNIPRKHYSFHTLFKKLCLQKKLQALLRQSIHPDFGYRLVRAVKTNRHIRLPSNASVNDFLIHYSRLCYHHLPHQYYIYGHTHYAMHIPLNKEATFTNLGSWFDIPHYAIYDGTKLQLKKWKAFQPKPKSA